jgi:hypothetical protein
MAANIRIGAQALNLPAWDSTSDELVVKRVLARETALYEVLIRRYNRGSIVWRDPFCGMTSMRKM